MSPQLLSYATPAPFTAFTTTRHGGVSTGNYAEMNISHYCGDTQANVTENRRRLANELGIAPQRLIVPRQVHGTEIRVIDNGFFEKTDTEQADCLEGTDALITDLANVCIGVSTADCIPVLLYDVKTKALAAVHAGWRGTVKNIAGKAVRALNV